MRIFSMSNFMTALFTIGVIAVANRYVPGAKNLING
jgi:hypothetical protein